MSRKLTTLQFQLKAFKIHGNIYDYSNSNYNGYENKISIGCPKHGEFWQTPHNHIGNKQGCPVCHCLTTTSDEFISNAQKIHKNKFDYSNVRYINNYTPVIIKCHIHGKFQQLPKNHLKGTLCPKCSKSSETYTTEEFIKLAKKIHGSVYDYTKVNYKKSQDKIKVICRKHGPFYVRPNNHLANKSGCPICKWSKGELKIFNYLTKHSIQFKRNKTFPHCISPKGWPLKYDFFIDSKKLLIEFDGQQHFTTSRIGYYTTTKKELTYTQKRDRIKTKFAKDNGIQLLRIPYWKEYKIEKILEKII